MVELADAIVSTGRETLERVSYTSPLAVKVVWLMTLIIVPTPVC